MSCREYTFEITFNWGKHDVIENESITIQSTNERYFSFSKYLGWSQIIK